MSKQNHKYILIVIVQVLLLTLDQDSFSQKKHIITCLDNHNLFIKDCLNIQILRNSYSINKKYPKQYETEFLTALSYFPKLRNVNIEVKEKHLEDAALESQPVFRLIGKREYVIYISPFSENKYIHYSLFHNLPFNARVGVIGHELAHIENYNSKSLLSLIAEFLFYNFSEKYFNRIENQTEKSVIEHGLGFQLLSWSEYQYFTKIARGLDDAYFSPNRIRKEIAIQEK